MTNTDPRPGVATTDLVRTAIDDTRTLVRAEVALARDEIRREIREAKASGIALGSAAVLAIVALALLLTALALVIHLGALSVFIVGLVLLATAAIAGWVGYRALPRQPMDETRHRVARDVTALTEQTT
jgi:VIT1/CCC1 family predicted Fe2+/Mn2+ transporter